MTDAELKDRIESSAGLRRIKADLVDEIAFRADGPARLDPMTILMIISIIVQVIAYCKKRRSPEEIVAMIQSARTQPLRRTLLLRRRLNRLCERETFSYGAGLQAPIYDAVADMAERASDEEIQELMTLADAYNAS